MFVIELFEDFKGNSRNNRPEKFILILHVVSEIEKLEIIN